MTHSVSLLAATFSTQVGHVDLMGESGVGRVCIKSVTYNNIIYIKNIARGTTDPWVDTITRGTL